MIKTENTAEKKENAADTCAAECAAEIKAGIRKQMRAMRRALDAEAVREASFAVAEKVRALPEFNSAGLLMAYMPAKNELDPMPLIECAKAAGKRIAFPLSHTPYPGKIEMAAGREISPLVDAQIKREAASCWLYRWMSA